MTNNSKRFDLQDVFYIVNTTVNTIPTGFSSAIAKVASDSKPSETIKPLAYVASFSTVVKNSSKDVFNRFTH